LNLLGHLYLSQNESAEARLFNLLGDRFKGNQFSSFTEEAQKGIRMHRDIDHFMDNHPLVSQLKLELSTHLPKVSGIALDIFFDYLLASNWSLYHAQDLDSFLDHFFIEIAEPSPLTPNEYAPWIRNLQENKYIHRYYDFESVVAISEHLHRKLKFKTEIDISPIIFYTFETKIRSVFEEYITDARENFGIS
jgi:acyl carrier protein phosphodiesterase